MLLFADGILGGDQASECEQLFIHIIDRASIDAIFISFFLYWIAMGGLVVCVDLIALFLFHTLHV